MFDVFVHRLYLSVVIYLRSYESNLSIDMPYVVPASSRFTRRQPGSIKEQMACQVPKYIVCMSEPIGCHHWVWPAARLLPMRRCILAS